MTEATITDLRDSVDRLAGEVPELRNQLRHRTRALWVAITVGGVILLVVIAAAYSVSLDNRKVSQANKDAIVENNRRWCPVVVPLAPRPGDPKPAGTPEQMERSLRIRDAFSSLVEDFGCR